MDTVIIAFERDELCRRFADMVDSSGTAASLICRSGDEVRRLLTAKRVRCVLCGYKLSDGLAEELYENLPSACAMLMVANQSQLELCGNPDIFKLAPPVGRGDIVSAVRMLLQLADHLERHSRPRRSQPDQEIIRQAKELLMAEWGMTEQQAHRYLQKRSMDAGARMADTARRILEEK